MSELKKPQFGSSQLQRPALSTAPHTGLSSLPHGLASSVITSAISTGAPLTKSVGDGIDSVPRTVRKQPNPVKQIVVVAPSSTNNTSVLHANPGLRNTRFTAPPPPPLIPSILPQPASTSTATFGGLVKTKPTPPQQLPANSVAPIEKSSQKTQTLKPTPTTNGTTSVLPTEKKKPSDAATTNGPSSDSSSDDSSSDSSSGEESEKEESLKNANSQTNKTTSATGATVVMDAEIPGPSGVAKRGRGRPRLATSTPKPAKQAKPGGQQRARTTPRKKSERVHKPPIIFSPDTAAGKAALPKRRGRGCGGCGGCRREDCGKCNYCKDKTKFGGPGRKKQRCALRVCSNFVKPLHGKGHPVQPGTPPREVAVIPVSKLASSLKVAEVIEQLRQNLTSSIPPVIDKDSVPAAITSLSAIAAATTALPKTTSFILSQPQQLKATSSTLTSVAASETKIVGPVAPSRMISKLTTSSTTPAVPSAPVTTSPAASATSKGGGASTKPAQSKASEAPKSMVEVEKKGGEKPTAAEPEKTTDTTKTPPSEVNKSSEIALRTRRKQQQQPQHQQVKEMLSTPTTTAPGTSATGEPDKIKCIVCGRERKPSLMRSNQFCTQRCVNSWSEKNAKGAETMTSSSPSSRRSTVETPMEVDKPATGAQQKKKLSRALKNLQIDMTWDRSSVPSTTRPPPSYTPTVPSTATPKPTMTSTPTPTATTATNKRPTSSTGVIPTAGKKLTKELEIVIGIKRPSTQQPPQNQKKMKEAEPAKAVSFNLTHIPTSTVDPIAAPPLSRTVPPPSISIVPLDQLTALGTALLSQQQRARKDEADSAATAAKFVAPAPKIPASLPVDVRSWTISQVVKFFESTSDCKDYAAVFREQEVDGTALLLLTHESLVKCLGIKLGRALKIMVHVEDLQKLYA